MTHDELLQFGARLRSRRSTLGYTQKLVSEQVGISLRFYQMLEHGKRNVSFHTLIRLSKTLAVSADYLLFGDGSF